jgi:radical SAM superfamily enzyme YgiQ (UPF0313 family)
MKMLLVEPTNIHAGLRSKFRVPPLALGVLASLTPSDWEVKIVQEPQDNIDFNEDVDLIGITAATNTVTRGYQIADEFRKRGKKVIMGGIHPTAMPEESLHHCDCVCIGEAEHIWKTMLSDFKEGKLRKTYKQKMHTDFDSYVPPDRSRMVFKRSLFFNVATVETSRGCPYNCDFCSVGLMHGRKIRHRPLKPLLEEIEGLNTKALFFVDNNIICNPDYSKKLFTEMIPLKKKWAAQATISMVKNRELMKLAKASGCFGLLVGIESVVEKGFTQYSKSVKDLEELREALHILKDHGIAVLGTMVFGNDFDTHDTIRRSLDNLLTLDLVTASLGILIPYPGTKIARVFNQENRILTNDWSLYDINHLVFKPKEFDYTEFLLEMQNLRRQYFSAANIARRSMSHAGNSVWYGLGLNLAMKLHNKLDTHPENTVLGEEALVNTPANKPC